MVALIAAAGALLPTTVSAHAQLLDSDPRPGSVLAAPPAAVTLLFTEDVTPAGTGIRVFAPSGRQVAGRVSTDGAALTAPVDASASGTYVVAWQVFAADTHPSRGAFAFSVGQHSANPFSALLSTPDAGTATPLGLALQALARAVHFAGFALAFGLAAYRVLVRSQPTFARWIGIGVALLVVAEPLALVAQLASLSFDSDTAIAVLGSTFGRIFGLRLAAAVMAWTVLATGRSWPLLALGSAVAVLDGASAHAIAGLPFAGQALVAVHVAAVGMWTGGLFGFIQLRDRRFPAYAVTTASVAVVSGLLLAAVHTDVGRALVTSDYGLVLLLKGTAVAAALCAALLARRRPELVFLGVAVVLAAVVAVLPPPF